MPLPKGVTPCEKCIYWEHTSGEEGNCLRKPPNPRLDLPDSVRFAEWPKTLFNDGCGDGTIDTEG